eukprot:1155134-Pelagomonas_calceolata.AAC.5
MEGNISEAPLMLTSNHSCGHDIYPGGVQANIPHTWGRVPGMRAALHPGCSTQAITRPHLGVQDGSLLQVDLDTGDVGTEQGQGDQGSRANGKALADGSGGVASSICACA